MIILVIKVNSLSIPIIHIEHIILMKGKSKKRFSTLRKIDSFFTDRLAKIVNSNVDYTRLPCPYSRVSELFILGKVLPDSKREQLNDLIQRYELLQRRIRQENSDLKGIINRQSRELINGKTTNVKILYEGEIYLLRISITEANFAIEKYEREIAKILRERKSSMSGRSLKGNGADGDDEIDENGESNGNNDGVGVGLTKDDAEAYFRETKAVNQLTTSCEIVESQIQAIEDEINQIQKLMEQGGTALEEYLRNNATSLLTRSGNIKPEIKDALSNVYPLKKLSDYLHTVFEKLVS